MKVKKVKNQINEQWKLIITPNPTKLCHYYISNYGRVKSVFKDSGDENIVKGTNTKKGAKYIRIGLKGNRGFTPYIHRMVAEYFLKNDHEGKMFVTHIDGNLENNHVSNIKILTMAEQVELRRAAGVYKNVRKKPSASAKMTETKVRLLKERLKKGKTKKKVLAKSFGISYMQLNRIERGENWGHVK